MWRNTDCYTLDSGRTALVLRALSKPAPYRFVERQLWQRRAAGLFVALAALQGRRSQSTRVRSE
jgi:hypothetical protein